MSTYDSDTLVSDFTVIAADAGNRSGNAELPVIYAGWSMGAVQAVAACAWTAVVAQLVPETELSSVATLNGLQFNISGILGPALGGLLLPLIGANQIFTANAR